MRVCQYFSGMGFQYFLSSQQRPCIFVGGWRVGGWEGSINSFYSTLDQRYLSGCPAITSKQYVQNRTLTTQSYLFCIFCLCQEHKLLPSQLSQKPESSVPSRSCPKVLPLLATQAPEFTLPPFFHFHCLSHHHLLLGLLQQPSSSTPLPD